MKLESRAVCSAMLARGEITQRVARVTRPTRDAMRMIERAELIRRKVLLVEDRRRSTLALLNSPDRIAPRRVRARRPNPGRRGPRNPHRSSTASRPFRTIAISVYVDVIEQIDAAVLAMKSGGQTTMSRSKLIRLAFQAFDVATIAGAAR